MDYQTLLLRVGGSNGSNSSSNNDNDGDLSAENNRVAFMIILGLNLIMFCLVVANICAIYKIKRKNPQINMTQMLMMNVGLGAVVLRRWISITF